MGLKRGVNMKVVLQAIIGSIAIHVIYIVGMMLVGYIKTKNYIPDIADTWDKVEILQNEVVFGKVISPPFGLFSIAGVAVIFGVIILSYKKLFN
jgi:hypothetical protein